MIAHYNPALLVHEIFSQVNSLSIGAVRYLNAKPLVYDLENLLPEAEVSFNTPRALADQLERGEIEVGLVPAIAYPTLGGGCIVPDIAIASRGPVLSVLLASKKPFEDISTLALDTSSYSSVTMAQVLCREKYGISPDLVHCGPDLGILDGLADALVIIGDPAMTTKLDRLPFVYDLGKEWTDFSGLPFVYAFWMARSGEISKEICEALQESKKRGMGRIRTIAEEEAKRLDLPASVCESYLKDNISFDLDEAAIAGMQHFFELCLKHHLIEKMPDLKFCC
ncbi:MAG: menaquinone biosynthesis protein [Planctomycetota bacterium]|nr:menaquinone biosynthesis protein [Planctomycetota bacterium]MDA1137979.1 menaquinone biosynthesis protein [Planctomycetota bacterium]